MYLAFGLIPPVSINHMFGTWALNMQGGMQKLLLVGIGAILWTIWLIQNDIHYRKCRFKLMNITITPMNIV
jgi:hypothetical protein